MAIDPFSGLALLLGVEEGESPSSAIWLRHEGRWKRQPDDGRAVPPTRRGATLVFDQSRNAFILHGGQTFDGEVLGDTWLFDGQSWMSHEGTAAPARRIHAAAYDPARKVMVVYGGRGSDNQRRDDTWEFDADGWKQVDTPGPPARYWPGMAYDSAARRLILFGGYSIHGHVRETWSYDGAEWTMLDDGRTADNRPRDDVPPGSLGVAAASHPDGGILLTGGMYSPGDVWRWRDGQWSRLLEVENYRRENEELILRQEHGPGQRIAASLCYDPVLKAFVYGGGEIRLPGAADFGPEPFMGWWTFVDEGRWVRLKTP